MKTLKQAKVGDTVTVAKLCLLYTSDAADE